MAREGWAGAVRLPQPVGVRGAGDANVRGSRRPMVMARCHAGGELWLGACTCPDSNPSTRDAPFEQPARACHARHMLSVCQRARHAWWSEIARRIAWPTGGAWRSLASAARPRPGTPESRHVHGRRPVLEPASARHHWQAHGARTCPGGVAQHTLHTPARPASITQPAPRRRQRASHVWSAEPPDASPITGASIRWNRTRAWAQPSLSPSP